MNSHYLGVTQVALTAAAMAKRSIDENPSDGWEKCFSKTYNKEYWFNSVDVTKSWTDPHKKSKGEVGSKEETDSTKTNTDKREAMSRPQVAIIVPYRDFSKERTREQ